MPGGNHRLTLAIAGSIALAIVTALLAPGFASSLQIGGEVFLRLLKMVVVPLVVVSVMSGILGMGDVRKLGRPGGATLLYYLATTVAAVAVGIVLVNLISPGVGAFDAQTLESMKSDRGAASTATVATIARNLVLMLFTDNLFEAAANGDLLPLIVFSLVFAGMLTTLGERVTALTEIIVQANHALLRFVLLLMNVAPFGIFCLVAARFGEAQAEGNFSELLQQLGWYMATVLIGLSVHAFGTLPLLLWVFRRRNPYVFIGQMAQALLTAFSTASSSATLPVTMETAQKRAGVSERSSEFVLPLGATVNMDGTALYEAVAAIFIAQALGVGLDLGGQITVALTATLAAIGAAGIPEAGLVTMVIVLNAVGLPVEYIGLILSVDWLLDRFRTAVNVLGDSIGAAVVDPAFGPGATVPGPLAVGPAQAAQSASER